MRRKYQLNPKWDTAIRNSQYMLLFETNRKFKKGDTLVIKNYLHETGEYLITNVYEERLSDVLKEDIVHKWYFADLVEQAINKDETFASIKTRMADCSYSEAKDVIKSTIYYCMKTFYKEPLNRIVQVVIFEPDMSYDNGLFDVSTEPNWQKTKDYYPFLKRD